MQTPISTRCVQACLLCRPSCLPFRDMQLCQAGTPHALERKAPSEPLSTPANLLIIILCSFFMFLRISAYCGPGPNCNSVPHVGTGGPKCIYAYDSDSFVESGLHRVATAPLENVAMGFCLSRHGLVQKEKSKFLECVSPNWRNTQDEHN